jgi:hypothetical protein
LILLLTAQVTGDLAPGPWGGIRVILGLSRVSMAPMIDLVV